MSMGLHPKTSFSQGKLSSLDFSSLVPNVEKHVSSLWVQYSIKRMYLNLTWFRHQTSIPQVCTACVLPPPSDGWIEISI